MAASTTTSNASQEPITINGLTYFRGTPFGDLADWPTVPAPTNISSSTTSAITISPTTPVTDQPSPTTESPPPPPPPSPMPEPHTSPDIPQHQPHRGPLIWRESK
ncbi:hypothetical protein B0H13DRAFT_1916615 [Mycena leptocephala]|nr:hypothetical protein B0H13DRAFT_1916615 [Mycena leptocephala]